MRHPVSFIQPLVSILSNLVSRAKLLRCFTDEFRNRGTAVLPDGHRNLGFRIVIFRGQPFINRRASSSRGCSGVVLPVPKVTRNSVILGPGSVSGLVKARDCSLYALFI